MCSVACVLISLSYITGVFVVGSAKGGELLTKTSVVTMCLVCSILVSVAFTSIMTMLAILNTNKAGNVVVSMLLALILLVSGSFIYQRLSEPEIYDNYVSVNEAGVPTEVGVFAAGDCYHFWFRDYSVSEKGNPMMEMHLI